MMAFYLLSYLLSSDPGEGRARVQLGERNAATVGDLNQNNQRVHAAERDESVQHPAHLAPGLLVPLNIANLLP